jgi:hypothetical protein
MMEKVSRDSLKLVVMTLPWRFVRFLGRIARRFFVAVGVLVALGILGYVEFESIVETIDSRYSRQIDAYLGIDKNAISRLHDPTYFAQESVIVSEDLRRVAPSIRCRPTGPPGKWRGAGILDGKGFERPSAG